MLCGQEGAERIRGLRRLLQRLSQGRLLRRLASKNLQQITLPNPHHAGPDPNIGQISASNPVSDRVLVRATLWRTSGS